MSQCVRLLFLQIFLIFLISSVSSYELPDYSQINQDVAIFLTPYGLAKNLTNKESPLRPFYFETPAGQAQLTNLKLGLMGLLFAIMLLNFGLISRGLKKP